MFKIIKTSALAVICIFLGGAYAYAGGLSATFVEEKLDNLKPGNTYSVKELTKRALVVNNTTKETTVDIEISPEAPVDYNLVAGYEPIPDISWVKIKKSYFENVNPGSSVETDISISIPSGEKYYGKKYQVYIYSHTAGQATFRVGIMSRILLNISPSIK